MNDTITTVVASIFSVLVLIAMLWILYRHKNPAKQKTQSESVSTSRVVNTARRFARSNGFRLIAPAHLSSGGKTAELDAILIGYFGVLGIRSLGVGGTIYGHVNDREWMQITDEKVRVSFPNPVKQTAEDMRVIRNALFAARLKTIPVEVIAVFAEKNVQLALPRDTGHYSYTGFKKLLSKDKFLKDAGFDLDAVENALRAALPE